MRGSGRRVGLFDVVRGLSVVSMALFHLCYDLRFLRGVQLGWFAPPIQDVWRASISWTFLFVAGAMCPLSRDNLRRALRYGAVALGIWAVTSVAGVDTAISFGIVYCMAACTLVAWALGRAGLTPSGPVAACALLALFALLRGLPEGTLGVGSLSVGLPRGIYGGEGLAWLGLPGPSFSSGDYYPLLPYLMVYLAGTAMGSSWAARGYPGWARRASVPALTFLGRHALAAYVIHQPVLLALTGLIP